MAKHAQGATRDASGRSRDDRWLSFTIRDDGAGFDVERTDAGAGLVNIHDRVGKAGGEIEVRSRVGAGTRSRPGSRSAGRPAPDGSADPRHGSGAQSAERRA